MKSDSNPLLNTIQEMSVMDGYRLHYITDKYTFYFYQLCSYSVTQDVRLLDVSAKSIVKILRYEAIYVHKS